MGSDDFFHRRKAKTANALARKKEKRSSYERVLIVCEGEKTEPNYFTELIDCLELNTANVEVDGNSDSSPSCVVKHAKKLYRAEKKTGDGFDKVFCVFDKDTHSTYDDALIEIKNCKPKNTFQAIVSVPCFEYWLLLHFEFSAKPFIASGNKSSCENLISDLKIYIPSYYKGSKAIYSKVVNQTKQAIEYSKIISAQAKLNDTDNPTTNIHELVEYLHNLKA